MENEHVLMELKLVTCADCGVEGKYLTMLFYMKVKLPEDTRTLDFYTRQSNSSDEDLTISSTVRLTLKCPI